MTIKQGHKVQTRAQHIQVQTINIVMTLADLGNMNTSFEAKCNQLPLRNTELFFLISSQLNTKVNGAKRPSLKQLIQHNSIIADIEIIHVVLKDRFKVLKHGNHHDTTRMLHIFSLLSWFPAHAKIRSQRLHFTSIIFRHTLVFLYQTSNKLNILLRFTNHAIPMGSRTQHIETNTIKLLSIKTRSMSSNNMATVNS